MKEKIVVKQKSAYGKTCYYPENDNAEIALSMTRARTGKRVSLTKDDLEKLEALGFEIEIKTPKVIYE